MFSPKSMSNLGRLTVYFTFPGSDHQGVKITWNTFCPGYGHFLLTPCFLSTIQRILCFATDFSNVYGGGFDINQLTVKICNVHPPVKNSLLMLLTLFKVFS
jgi:hypothetical protein